MADAWSILIEVTNACHLRCSHCTAGVAHVRRPYFMSLEQLEQALQSLNGWKKGVGCFGGEPTLHPQFPELCALFSRYFPKRQLAIWTAGGPQFESYRDLIDRTFALVAFNDHQSPGFHKPILIANEEVVHDEATRRTLIEHCWVPSHWSPLITHRGAFFCEIAATFDNLFDGPGGHPLEPGWWKKDFSAFAYQREANCGHCSIPLPLETLPDDMDADCVSPGNAERLRKAGSPLAAKGRLRVIDAVDLKPAKSIQRNPRWFATPGTPHYWTRLSVRSGFWLAAQYRYVPQSAGIFVRDLSRFAALTVAHKTMALAAAARATLRGRKAVTPGVPPAPPHPKRQPRA
jgi:hypothetical protein